MYSIVLATMLTTGSATPAWCHGGWGCHGCWGCHSYCGCYSGCYSYCGCWGGWGGYGYYGYGYGCWGCYGCYSCYSCCSCCGCYGSAVYYQPTTVIKTAAAVEVRQPTADEAKVTVRLPANATLIVDGQATNQKNSATRTFFTPKLERNQDYTYAVKAEVVRNGQTISETKSVVVRAGRASTVDFGDMSNTVARSVSPDAAPARITVTLPADAKLFVDGVACNLTTGTRSFETPKLNPGQTYSYMLKAEVERNGQMRSDSRRVTFEAGKQVAVDFRALETVNTASSR